jgi:hypothetical protein
LTFREPAPEDRRAAGAYRVLCGFPVAGPTREYARALIGAARQMWSPYQRRPFDTLRLRPTEDGLAVRVDVAASDTERALRVTQKAVFSAMDTACLPQPRSVLIFVAGERNGIEVINQVWAPRA